MKKQVSVKLVAQNKEGWDVRDVIQYLKDDYPEFVPKGSLALGTANVSSSDSWQAMTLLILDESAEIKEGDKYAHTYADNTTVLTCEDDSELPKFNRTKIIASHPCISNTLPISKSFLEMFVKMPDAKVYVECENLYHHGNYQNRCITCKDIFNGSDKMWFFCEKCSVLPKLDSEKCILLTLENEEVKEEVDVNEQLADALEMKGKYRDAYDVAKLSAKQAHETIETLTNKLRELALQLQEKKWTDEDMRNAWTAYGDYMGVPGSPNFDAWLENYTHSKH